MSKNQAKGRIRKTKDKINEVVGVLTGDKTLKARGKAHQASDKLQEV